MSALVWPGRLSFRDSPQFVGSAATCRKSRRGPALRGMKLAYCRAWARRSPHFGSRFMFFATTALRDRFSKSARRNPAAGVRRLRLEQLEPRWVLSTSYIAHDLVSDQPGVAPILDEHLVNAWGLSLGPAGGNFWVSSNEEGISTLYTGDVGGTPLTKVALEVNIPGGAPTGQVFNGTGEFLIHSGANLPAPAVFIFASESGQVSGWNPNEPPPPPSHDAQSPFQAMDGAIYKG